MNATFDRDLTPRRVRVRDWEGVLVIQTGLSVVVHGHMIDVQRDDERVVATVRVRPQVPQPPLSDAQVQDIRDAADLLAGRARRTLGSCWAVVPWDGFPRPDTYLETPKVEKVAGANIGAGSGV